MKRTWQAPQLVILTRSNPEEVVLTICKTESGQTGNPDIQLMNCDRSDVVCSSCDMISQS